MNVPIHNLLTPAEAAALFGVAAKTVARWADTGKLTSVRTPGGHRRFRWDEIRQMLAREESSTFQMWPCGRLVPQGPTPKPEGI